MTWASMLRTAALGMATSLLFLMVVGAAAGSGVDPFLVVIGLLFAFGAIWQARWRGGSTYVAVLSILWFLLAVSAGYRSLTRPVDWAEFVAMVASVVFPALAVFAYRGGRRAGWDVAAPTRPLAGCLGVLAAALVMGLVATFTAESATPQTGDVKVVAKRFLFEPAALSARAGRISVFVDNKDPSHHDFTIDGVVRLEVPSFHARRASFVVQPGVYAFVCKLHDGMDGTLTVR